MVSERANPLIDLKCPYRDNPDLGEFSFSPAVAVQAFLGVIRQSTMYSTTPPDDVSPVA